MVLQISGVDTPTVIAFNNGLFLKIAEGGNKLFGVIESLPLGIGMGMIAPKGMRPTIFSTDHRQIHTRWNCYTDSMTPHFIRSVHGDNDSGARVYGVEKRLFRCGTGPDHGNPLSVHASRVDGAASMMTDNLRAAVFMMTGSSAFAVNDTFLKLLGDNLGMFQIITMRGVVVSLIFALLLWMQRAKISALVPKDRWLLAMRSGAEMGAAFFFFNALFHMPLAAVTAILQVVPLTVAAAAYLFLKEPLGWRRLSAILIGMGGVMLIVRPGTDSFTMASVHALLCVLMVTLRDLTTRVMAKGVPSSMVALTTAIGVTLMGAVGSVTEHWVVPAALSWAWLGGTVVFTVLGYYLVILAMRTGELTFVAPFRVCLTVGGAGAGVVRAVGMARTADLRRQRDRGRNRGLYALPRGPGAPPCIGRQSSIATRARRVLTTPATPPIRPTIHLSQTFLCGGATQISSGQDPG